MTTVALPMVHDSIPLTKSKSYLSWPELPYLRLPSFQKVAKNDIVVFNWPSDTVHYFFEPKGRPGVIKPIDKKSNYVKRCVGIPGDKIEIKNTVPNIMSSPKSQDTYGIPEIVKYPYWIDIIFVSREFEVISYYDLAPTDAGIAKLSELGLPRYFPAVVMKKNGAGKFYYFSGDFADNPVSGSSYNFYGIEKLWRMFLHSEDYSQRNSFFWNYYYPLMGSILKDTYQRNEPKKQKD